MKFHRISILPMVLFMAACTGGSAPQEANRFLHNLYPGQTFHVTCQDFDSDGDGYVSCTAVQSVAEGATSMPTPLPLECSSDFSWSSGCRIQRARIQQ